MRTLQTSETRCLYAHIARALFIAVKMASSAGRVLVYGGKGALGSAIVNHFKSNNWVRRCSTYLWQKAPGLDTEISVCSG